MQKSVFLLMVILTMSVIASSGMSSAYGKGTTLHTPADHNINEFGNDWITVELTDDGGQYSFKTGPLHTAGAGERLLYPVETGYDTLRSANTGNDYTTDLDLEITSQVIGATSATTIFNGGLGDTGFGSNGDDFTMIQNIEVFGTSEETTSASVTTTIINNNAGNAPVEFRYFLDYQVNGDDGPALFPQNPDSGPILTEFEWAPGDFQFGIIDDNNNPPIPLVTGVGWGPGLVRGVFGSWSDMSGTTFDYTIDPTFDVATEDEEDDSAILLYFGQNSPINIPGGGQVQFAFGFGPSESNPSPESPVVGGEFLSIDSTALLLAGLQSSAIWMLPVLAGAAGVGAFYIKTRMNKE